MKEWRFSDGPAEGEAWAANPKEAAVYIDFREAHENPPAKWYRLWVGTRGWLEGQLRAVTKGPEGPSSVALPRMLVLPDAEPEELPRLIQT